MVAQVALAVVVVTAAAMLTRSVVRLQSLEMGFAADRLVVVPLLDLPAANSAERVRHLRLLETLTERLEGTDAPGVRHGGPRGTFAGKGGWDAPRFTAEGQTPERAAANVGLNLESVRPGYFGTFGVTLVRGRAFEPSGPRGAREGHDGQPGRRRADLARPGSHRQAPDVRRTDSSVGWLTIVGVAALTRYRELAQPRPTMYIPGDQFIPRRTLVVRTPRRSPGWPTAFARGGRGRGQREGDARSPFAELLERPLARPRFNASCSGCSASPRWRWPQSGYTG